MGDRSHLDRWTDDGESIVEHVAGAEDFRELMMRALIVAASLFVPVPAYALEIGARLPTRYGEVIVVKNDGGVKPHYRVHANRRQAFPLT